MTIRAQLPATAHSSPPSSGLSSPPTYQSYSYLSGTAYILPNRFDSFLLTDHSLLTIRVTSRVSEGKTTASSFGPLWSVPLSLSVVHCNSNYQALYCFLSLHVSWRCPQWTKHEHSLPNDFASELERVINLLSPLGMESN